MPGPSSRKPKTLEDGLGDVGDRVAVGLGVGSCTAASRRGLICTVSVARMFDLGEDRLAQAELEGRATFGKPVVMR